MRIFKILPILAALSIPFIGGCKSEPETESVSLKSIRTGVSGIHLFDKNENEVLDTDEIRNYLDIMIGNNKSNLEVACELENVRASLRAASPTKHTAGLFTPHTYTYPPNIEQTAANFRAVADEYLQKHYDEKDEAIAEKLKSASAIKE